MATITTLRGHSSATVTLHYEGQQYLVRKQGDIAPNLHQLRHLNQLGFRVPAIYRTTSTTIDMEYIPGIDMAEYLLRNHSLPLIDFITSTIDRFQAASAEHDYTIVYQDFLATIDTTALPFTTSQLLARLPPHLPQTITHGDFTLENIIYSTTGEFVMIDASRNQWTSTVFDIAKMRQDLEGGWHTRSRPQLGRSIQVPLLSIKEHLQRRYPLAFNDYIYILMLLRVWRHTQPHTLDYQLITSEIIRLWK